MTAGAAAVTALRAAACALSALPPRAAYAAADRLGDVLRVLDRRRGRIIRANLRVVYGRRLDTARGRRAARLLEREAWRNVVRMALEVLRMPRDLPGRDVSGRIACESLAAGLRIHERRGGMVLLSGHTGNWEMLAPALGSWNLHPALVARPLDQPEVDAWVNARRERTGARIVGKKGTIGELLDELRAGGVLGIVFEQDAGSGGFFVPFFGARASTTGSPALLALRADAPILVGGARRLGAARLHHRIDVEDVIEPADVADLPDMRSRAEAITARAAAAVCRRILLAPDQWLWHHRRWKTRPADEDPLLDVPGARRARARRGARAARDASRT